VICALFADGPVRGWTRDEVLLCVGFAEASQGTFWLLFDGLQHLNRQYLREAGLERVLSRPMDPYWQLLRDHLRPEAIPTALLGLGIVLWLLPWAAVTVPVFALGGAALLGGVLTVAASSGFWVRHPGTAIGLAWQLSAAGQYPPALLPPALRFLVTFVVPFAMTGYVPAAWCLGRIGSIALLQPIVGLAAFGVGYAVFLAGVGRWGRRGG
jgi:ABC-2 type transport system permease protein